jgi:hypothetical protein
MANAFTGKAMHPLNWSVRDTNIVIGAIKFICTERQTVALQPLHVEFLEGFRDHVFRHHELDIDDISPVTPLNFAKDMTDPEHQARALEYLTLAPYVQEDVPQTQADIVDAFFAAVGAKSDSMIFLRNIAHHHIFLGQLCIARKLVPHLLPGGPMTQMSRAFRMLRESRGDPRLAATYQALEACPLGSLGSAFYRFHRNRGFALPGEPGCIPEELSAIHDLTHILSGYNTDAHGEIAAQAFAGGAMERHGMLAAVSGLLSYHNGLVFDGHGRYPLQKGNMQPQVFAAAFARGMRSVSLLSGWAFKDDWMLPVASVRKKMGIVDAVDVWDDPPPDQRAATATP